MSGYLIFTMPNITVREAAIRLVAEQGVDTTLLSVTVDLRVSDAAAAYKAAGIVIQRIQGEATTLPAAKTESPMTPDLRFYFDGMAKTYRLQCLDCGDDFWRYDHALERRHIVDIADLALSHVCGVAS